MLLSSSHRREPGNRILKAFYMASIYVALAPFSSVYAECPVLPNARYVNQAAGVFQDGSRTYPFNTVIEGVLDASDNGFVQIVAGTYPESLLLTRPMKLQSCDGTAIIGTGNPPSLLDCVPGTGPYTDLDGDGIIESCEEYLAQKYAPIVYHSSDESNLPTNVDWFLARTSLWFYDDACNPDLHAFVINPFGQNDLLGQSYPGGCGSTDTVYSDATRSRSKQRTFYLADVAETNRIGSLDSNQWRTYFHAYKNSSGGVTIQYWRFYAYNDYYNNHGGDWEGIQIVLDQNLQPYQVGFLGHTSIDYQSPANLQWEGSHPRIYSEGGGHASFSTGDDIQVRACNGFFVTTIDPEDPCTFIRQETWSGGQVQWCDNNYVPFCTGGITPSGGLVNLGAKIAPLNGQSFLKYSGIWGSPGFFFETSGYWGPAYNETAMREDGYITAWCANIEQVDLVRECYPKFTSR